MTIYSQISSNKQKTFLIFALFIVLISGFFYIVGLYYGDANGYLVLGLIISSVSSVFSYFFSDKIVLFSVGALPADKTRHFNFYTAGENMAIVAGIPMPKLYVIRDAAPNAFATGRDPQHAIVCATEGLLGMMDRAELEGVIAHEISHIKNYDMLVMTVVSVLVGTISLVADWILRSMWWGHGRRDNDERRGGNPLVFVLLLVALIIAPLTATLIQLAISRKREYLADADGALLTRRPNGLASALEKIAGYPVGLRSATTATAHLFISNPFKKNKKGDWFVNLFSTHPPIEERIRLLREM
ncbi:MAG: M48 family metalloprotease [bacterium]